MRRVPANVPVLQPAPDEINERADQILSRAEFNSSESVLDRIGAWLNEFLNDLLSSLSQGGAGSFIAWLILAALVAAAVYLLVRLQPWTLTRGRRAREVSAVSTTTVKAPELQTAKQWRLDADALAAEGKFNEALRARYRAVLADLVSGGAIKDLAGRTPGEYRAEIASGAPAVAAPFAQLTDQFENVWYGADPATADTLFTFKGHERAVLAGVQP